MDKLAQMFMESLLKDLCNGGGEPKTSTKEKDAEKAEQIRKDCEGFKSLVSDEERKLIAELADTAKKLVNVHNDRVTEVFLHRNVKSTAQQDVHYSTYGDIVKDIISNIQSLEVMDTVGVEALAEFRVENDLTYEKMAFIKTMNRLTDMFG